MEKAAKNQGGGNKPFQSSRQILNMHVQVYDLGSILQAN